MTSIPKTKDSGVALEDHSLADLIWNGEYVEEESHLEDLRRVFLEKLLKSEELEGGKEKDSETRNIENKIKASTSHWERIQIVKEYFQWIPLSSAANKLFQKLGKNANLSTIFRERGNVEYKKRRLPAALRGYNLAILFGRPGHEECGLAYANRAALLLHVNEPQLALRDVDLAVSNQFPQNLTEKLEERKRKCQSLMELPLTPKEKLEDSTNSPSSNTEGVDGTEGLKSIPNKNQTSSAEVNQVDSKRHVTDKEYCDREFFTLRQPNELIIGAEKFLNIEDTQTRGRRLVVNQDVSAGTLLLLERPFVTVLEKELRWDVEHCHLCLNRILAGIPCEHCTFAIYCSEECRHRADSFHQYEHHLWCYLHGIQSSRRDLLATRIIERIGPEGVLKRYQQRSLNCPTPPVAGFNQDGIYDSSTYDPVHHLVSHSSTESLYDTVSNAFKALVITNLLQEKTQFFTQLKNLIEKTIEKNQTHSDQPDLLVDFTASLIFHHLENIPYNAISLSEFRPKDRTPEIGTGAGGGSNLKFKEIQENPIISVSYASAIFGLLAMCNHSCSPNAVHVRQMEKQTTALVALRNLKKGEEVCITYGPLFTVHAKPERQSVLKDKYNFDCDCAACVGNWNSTIELVSDKSQSDDISKYEDELREVHKLIVEKNQFVEGMERVRPCLKFFGSNFAPTFLLTQVAQDLFKKALVNIVNKNQNNHFFV